MNSRRVPSAPRSSPDEYGFATIRQPRPIVRTGSVLVMAGGLLHVIAVYLPWYDAPGVRLKGLDTFLSPEGAPFYGPGKIWLVVGLTLLALGLVMYVAGRIYAVAIAATIVAAIGVFTSLLGVGSANNMKSFTGVGQPAMGCWVGIMSILLALAGAIQVLSKRRR